ncbi:Trehalose 2-sulfotransferase OS=Tsukamurella paurometabola (strain ATCC 8368 / DSM / CCUG 35730/ CIP 100753 / JCM 10117 / KCTC 9821 / NBRC 16120 / NCIMB 702349 / NCTC 13040) OX=521096 GN=Tpau_3332 PE=3 SV=1 [Tsukamurella paurometabola]|uniref:Trehalose 2-sulfotransferase n=1 Tax=Tsukamurella paurometabola (strain ATCC 8368 / DSM 20162 / CCUG 35730 / CIP 100753 / JCM 10117 / KCTC 9821 / NBRC 16120 / NCIMB 702349 / NCTC 13040) TaxID=521096 RepID=D5UWB7_TSUPD|nr:Stf0 family sulfotransferase [Tsukamurella paurometabola]ADG79916.1 Stf0 sulfotransferase [Tsukamurella paurometabola DSM 20162]SUP37648.1 Stf0 sulphotransferase [Tsukamurella paurometabola]
MSQPPSYLVCASQRSGSTLLVESLAATGVAGNPQEFFQYFPSSSLSPQPREWFAGVDDPDLLALLDPTEAGTVDTRTQEQWRADVLTSGRTSNGVWGGKLMWNQTPILISRTRVASGSLRTAVRSLFDGADPVYVHVFRPDVVPQAVSMWRAVQTRTWRDDPDHDRERDERAVYRAEGIAHLAGILLEQERAWRAWFAAEAIEPLEIDFTELIADPRTSTARVLEALGQDPALAPPPPLKPQSNERSKEWAQRYRADAAQNGYPA